MTPKLPAFLPKTGVLDGNRERLHQCTLEFFRNKPQHKNANIANFILAVPLENN